MKALGPSSPASQASIIGDVVLDRAPFWKVGLVLYSAIELTGIGGDAFFLALVVVFFALCLLLVKACEAIMGPDPTDTQEGGVGEHVVAAAAPARERAEVVAR
jgi:hypothetical protein